MHSWGDGFEYFGEVGKAANEIGKFCRRYGRIMVTTTKEKYGTSRVYCMFGLHSLHTLTHPGYVYSQYPQWLWTLDIWYLSKFFRFKPINYVTIRWQIFIYRLAYKKAIKKYPFIRKEILNGSDYPEILKDL